MQCDHSVLLADPMEGEASELEIDSELVMSFYDQYQADDIACKVYGVNTGIHSLDDPDSGGTGHYTRHP